MKRFSIMASFLLVVILLSGCSSDSKPFLELKPSFELVDFSVSISNDESLVGWTEITEGEQKGERVVPTVLYYEFTLKNAGAIAFDRNPNEILDIKLDPSEKLTEVSQETMGLNIFDQHSNFGYGYTLDLYLKPGDQRSSVLYYVLGVSEIIPTEATPLAPSDEKLNKLLEYATDADLVILRNGLEIARFDLSLEPNKGKI